MSSEKDKKEETALTSKPSLVMTKRGFEPTTMESAWRMAEALAQSTLVPAAYRGKPGSCLIAIDLALRLNSSWLMVMQNVYDVKGRLGMEAKFCIALINQSGLFVDPLEYEVVGDDPKAKNYKVRAIATRKRTGKVLQGPWITWDLVSAEGWDKKEGSKWLTMPDQMFHYRAASWFANRFCPEVKNGMITTDEAEEIIDVESYEVKQAVTGEKIKDDAGSEPMEPKFEENNDPAQMEESPQDLPAPDPDIVEENVNEETGEVTEFVCHSKQCNGRRFTADMFLQIPGKTGIKFHCPYCRNSTTYKPLEAGEEAA